MNSVTRILFCLLAAVPCQAQVKSFALDTAVGSLPAITGKSEKAGFLSVTAGDRLYAIGSQAGSFPETGFHVKGEMGGVWMHPVKLMDGFRLKIVMNGREVLPARSDSFITYPLATQYVYRDSLSGLRVVRTQFVPDHIPLLVVEYALHHPGKDTLMIEGEFLADIDLRPVWLGEKSGMMDGPDTLLEYDQKSNLAVFRDGKSDWHAGVSCDFPGMVFEGIRQNEFTGKGLSGVFTTSDIRIPPDKTLYIRYYISGSTANAEEAKETIRRYQPELATLFYRKQDRYRAMDNRAVLRVPDTLLQEAWQWGKYTTDWLIRDVPGLGRGLGAGFPDYPWFFSNDQAVTFRALTGMIEPDLFYDSWKMLKEISAEANGNSGRIIHEASTNGVVYDQGRMEESQLHLIAAWEIFKWTGDLVFLRENYVYGQKMIRWLMQHDTDGDLYVEGYGGVEIEGLDAEMLDVAVCTQLAFSILSEMAAVLGELEQAGEYHARADTLKEKINRDWWVASEHRYADFIADTGKALELIGQALEERIHPGRNSWAREKLQALKSTIENNTYADEGYAVYYNTSGILPVKEGIADSTKAREVLEYISFFTNRFGLYITGIERPDDIRVDEGSVYARRGENAFSYSQAVMPAATGSLAIAECRYGNPDTALKYIHKILETFSYATPGTTYEVSPDYGMFVQAWNITGLYMPVSRFFFGIAPMAYKKEITLDPDFPGQWPRARLDNLLIGGNRFSVSYRKDQKTAVYRISCAAPGWKIYFRIPEGARRIQVNGREVPGHLEFAEMRALENTLTLTF